MKVLLTTNTGIKVDFLIFFFFLKKKRERLWIKLFWGEEGG